ncbi:MAG: hypothetical protein JWN47_2337 [Frankiales bacterium]|nr:hypothetical protein [Frankiales bacterium]
MTVVVQSPIIEVGHQPLAERWVNALISVRIDRGLGLVGRTLLRFTDEGYALAATGLFKIGLEVGLSTHTNTVLMTGTVTGISLEQDTQAQPELIVTVDDAGFKLARGTQNRTFVDHTYTQVIQQLAQKAGLRTKVDADSGAAHEYLLQTGSDLAYLNSIAERMGYVWWVDDDVLSFRKAGTSTGSVTRLLPDHLTEFNVHASGLRPTEVTVTGWDSASQQRVSGHNTGGTSKIEKTRSDFADAGSADSPALGKAPLASPFMHPKDAGAADQTASSLMEDWLAGSVVARGACPIDPALKPAVTLEVKNAGPASGKYLITRVEHHYSQHGFYTRFTAGGNRPASLVDNLGPAQASAGFDFPGLAIGVVTDNNDPTKEGRVKIKFVGLAPANGQDIGSAWARLVSLGAGNQRGMVFLPEVNDEVLVGFEHGDTRHPVVLGGLYSKNNALPTWDVASGKVTTRRITSRDGHLIEFSDGEDAKSKHVLLQLANGDKLRLGNDRFDIQVASGIPISIKAGNAKFEISDAGDVTIEANNITLKAKAKLDLQGSSEATVKSSGKTAVQGSQLNLKGDMMAELEGGGQLALKGGMVAIN